MTGVKINSKELPISENDFPRYQAPEISKEEWVRFFLDSLKSLENRITLLEADHGT